MRIQRLLTGAALASVLFGAAAFAQPPNDDCTGAIPVFDGNNTVDNTNATTSVTLPGPCLVYDPYNFVYAGPVFSGVDTWYSYTAPATGIRNFEITNDANSVPSTTLALYEVCGGTLLACNTGGGVSAAAKIYHYPVTSGTTYLIRYSRYAAFAAMDAANLNISAPPAPSAVPFDECDSAGVVPGAGGLVPFDLTLMTNGDVRAFDSDPFRKDAWYSWTPSMSGIAVVRGCSDTVPVSANLLRFAAYPSCTGAPLASMQNVTDPGFATACFPDISWNVEAGQTYLVRVATGRMTAPPSGNIVFEIRPSATGFSIPAGAVAEAEPCSNNSADDTNGGCAITPNASVPIQLCTVYSGTTTARREPYPGGLSNFLNFDNDSYEFTLAQDDTITITGQSEFHPRAELRVGCNPFTTIAACATNNTGSTVGLTYNLGEKRVSGVVSSFTVTLVAGTYQYFISPLGTVNNWQDCSGGNRYWFKITSSEPCTGACCNGTTCTTGTQAACTGTYQGDGVACGPIGNPTTCCPANFDGVDGLQVADIFAFLNAWFASDPRTDVDGVGGIQVADIFAFLNAWFAGC